MKKWIVSLIVLVVLVGCGVGVGVAVSNKNKRDNTATAVVAMDFDGGQSADKANGATITTASDDALPEDGPSFQFVLNADNKILSVNCLSGSADVVLSTVDVEGNAVSEASAKITASLIEKGFAKVDVTKGNANIFSLTVTAPSDEQAEKIKSLVKQKFDNVFDENGIFGTVKTAVKQDVEDMQTKYAAIASQLGMDASEFANKTETEVLTMVKDYSQKIEDVAGEKLDELKKLIDDEFAKLDVEKIKSQLATAKEQLATAKKQLADYQEQLKQLADGELKTQMQALIDNAQSAIDKAQAKVDELQQNLDKLIAEAQKAIDEFVAKVIEESKTIAQTIKTNAEKFEQDFKAQLDAHKQEFQANKEERLAQIKAWRESIEGATSDDKAQA